MNEKKSSGFAVSNLALISLLVALTIIMGTTPLGTIPTPALNISLVTIPLAIASMTVGTLGGIICGLVFGLCSLYLGVSGADPMGAALFHINPIAIIITTIVPRILVGLFTSLIYKSLSKKQSHKKIRFYISAFACPFLNTLLFMSTLCVFFYNTKYIQNMMVSMKVTNVVMFIIALVGLQAIIEMAVCCVVGGKISSILVSKALKGDKK